MLAAVVAAGALTHYFFLLSLTAVGAWLLVSDAPAATRRSAARALAVGLLPFAAWTPFLAVQLAHHRFSFIGAFDGHTVLATYWLLFARAQPHATVLNWAAPLLVLAAVVGGSIVVARRSDAGRLCALLAVLPLLMAALLWLAGLHIFDVRNLIGIGPFAAVALAALLARLPAPSAVLAVCLCVFALALAYTRGDRVAPLPYDQVAKALVAEGWRPDDPILIRGNVFAFRAPLAWYLPGRPALRVITSLEGPWPRAFLVASARDRSRAVRTASATRHVGRLLVARLDSVSAQIDGSVLLVRSETKP